MKTKKRLGILVILIIATIVGIFITKNKKKDYDNQISNLNNQITQLQQKELEYTELVNKKDEFISKTKKEILESKKGSTLTDLEDEKANLVNEINNL